MKRNNHNINYWLKNKQTFLEFELPETPAQPDGPGFGPPINQPGSPADPLANNMGAEPQPFDPNQPNEEDDITNDPQFPEMPEDEPEDLTQDFELWRQKYIEESIKGDPNALIDLITPIRNRRLDPNPSKFVEDNLQICMLRQSSNIYQASAKFRSLLKKDIDRNLPAISLLKHLMTSLDENPLVSDNFIKILGGLGAKQDWHRKFIAALFGAVQVGSGSLNEDLIFQETDYSIPISTRFNTKWGDVLLGPWELVEGDPERFLKEVEMERLQGGSPEERDVLRKRIVLESISDHFKQRSFIITTVNTDATINHLALDLGNCLESGYLDGRIIVKSQDSDTRQIFISDEGDIVTIPELTIYYVREVNQGLDQGVEEIEFIRHRDGQLFLSAQPELLTEASSTLQGLLFKEIPWRGNPTDFLAMSRCVPTLSEILNRRCQ